MAPADESVSELLRGLRHISPVVRVKAARGLVKFNTPPREAFAVLLKAVDDPEQTVREASIQALATYGQLALPSLAEFLTHPDKYVRRNAVWAIGKLGPAARTVLSDLCIALLDAEVVETRKENAKLRRRVNELELRMSNMRVQLQR